MGDAAHTIVRAGLSAIPIVGGPAVELFNSVVIPPLERRRAEWQREVGERLHLLEQSGLVRVADLGENDAFIDAVMAASVAAMKTAVAEKRAALRNAVLNAALPNPPDVALQQLFVRLVDQFTVWHLRFLNVAANPNWYVRIGSTQAASIRKDHEFHQRRPPLAEVVKTQFPELKNRSEFYNVVWAELDHARLVEWQEDSASFDLSEATSLGQAFLRFIRDPIPKPRSSR